MPFDYKKEYREFYLPPKKPHLITIPRMNFVAVHGKGDPNAPGGAYQEAMGVLYGIAFTIKMSYKGSHKMDGYFEYVVPPLEGLWHQKGVDGVDYAHKETFEWTSMLPIHKCSRSVHMYCCLPSRSTLPATQPHNSRLPQHCWSCSALHRPSSDIPMVHLSPSTTDRQNFYSRRSKAYCSEYSDFQSVSVPLAR